MRSQTSVDLQSECLHFLFATPQEIARERQEAAKKIAAGTEETVRAAQALAQQEDVKMPKRMAIECLKEVARQVNLYPSDEEIRASDLAKMVQDTI